MVVAVALITIWPELVTWLPDQFLQKEIK
jgi:TRAP-type C4-dicarboxylate transport system permease large subunit